MMMNDAQKRLRGLALAETGFLFDPITGHTYTLNRTGGEYHLIEINPRFPA